MCKAFSCLVTRSNKVYWQAGIDSHSEIQAKFVKEDKELKDDKLPPKNTFARIEITPNNNNYLKPDKWGLHIDENVTPSWLSKRHEDSCMKAFKKWEKEVYSGIDLKALLKPIHPFKIKPPKIEKKHLKILLHWASVRDSVGASVWASVGASVRASVGASVRAYTGTFFPKIKKWKYVDFKHKGYPFNDAVKLWKMGLVASFCGDKWRLHGGRKAKILWEGTITELKQQCK